MAIRDRADRRRIVCAKPAVGVDCVTPVGDLPPWRGVGATPDPHSCRVQLGQGSAHWARTRQRAAQSPPSGRGAIRQPADTSGAGRGVTIAMRTVRDVMTGSVISVAPEMPIKEVARLLVEHRISGLPVVGEDGTILGVVTEGDLLVKGHDLGSLQRRPLARIFGESRDTRSLRAKAEARTAGQAMSAPAITIGADASIHEAAAVMIERKVNRLPVVDGGRLVGIVARADVVRTLARSDDDLAQDVRRDALWKALWIDPSSFQVEVADGVATVTGRVNRRSTAAIVERVVRSVPGIVGVVAQVEWSVDDRGQDAAPPERVSIEGNP